MAKAIKRGNLYGDKIQYEDGISCCVWYPAPEEDDELEDFGLCFDFSYDDIDDLIALLEEMKEIEAEPPDLDEPYEDEYGWNE